MEITYIFRSQSKQRSIERVFEPILENMRAEGHDVNVEFAVLKGNIFSTLWKNMWHFRKVSKNRLCHITGDVQYIACLMEPKNTVLTIHDLVPLHNKNVPWYSKWLCYWLWYYIPLKRLKKITCISEATYKDLISFFPWCENKVTIIPNPIASSFHYVQKDLNVSKPVVLHIGTKSNKNLIRVIEALDGLSCHLRIIGHIPETELKVLKTKNIDFSNEFFVSDKQIIREYEECDIVSFPSLFEGFGMPIIEGQTIGRAVLTSNIEPMVTVAGKGACLVDPESIESIRCGFVQLIQDSQYYNEVTQAGLENAKLYTPMRITNKYKQIYNELCIIY